MTTMNVNGRTYTAEHAPDGTLVVVCRECGYGTRAESPERGDAWIKAHQLDHADRVTVAAAALAWLASPESKPHVYRVESSGYGARPYRWRCPVCLRKASRKRWADAVRSAAGHVGSCRESYAYRRGLTTEADVLAAADVVALAVIRES